MSEMTIRDGHEGFGDSWVQQTDARILRTGVLLGLRPLLLGQDSRHIPKLWDRLWRSVRNHGLHPAMSAVDLALWDLKARSMGQPVWQLLGGLLRDRLDKARITRLRTERQDMPLAVDSNGAYDVADAIAVGAACDAAGVRWFEESCPYTNVEALAAVSARLKTPISGFQSDTTVYALRRHLSLDSLAIFQPSFDKCGGISQGVKIANVLDAWGRRLVPHSAAPPLSFLAAGFIAVPSGPGLGVEIDMDRVGELDQTGGI